MSNTCPTVKICNPDEKGEFIVINEEDFDKKIHKPFVEPKADKADKKADKAE